MLQRGGARAGGKSDSKEQSQSSRQTVAIQAGGHTGCQARPHLPQPVPPPQRTAPPPGHTHAPEAELGVCCKAAAGGEHDDRWRHEGVLRRKGDLACRQTMGQAGRHWGAFRQWWRGGLMVEASHARAALCKAAEQLRQLRQAGRRVWQQARAVVDASFKVCASSPLQAIVPLQQIVGCWVRGDLRRRLLQ